MLRSPPNCALGSVNGLILQRPLFKSTTSSLRPEYQISSTQLREEVKSVNRGPINLLLVIWLINHHFELTCCRDANYLFSYGEPHNSILRLALASQCLGFGDGCLTSVLLGNSSTQHLFSC